MDKNKTNNDEMISDITNEVIKSLLIGDIKPDDIPNTVNGYLIHSDINGIPECRIDLDNQPYASYDVVYGPNDVSHQRNNKYGIHVDIPYSLSESLREYSEKTTNGYYRELVELTKRKDSSEKEETITRIKNLMSKYVIQALLCKEILSVSDDEFENLLVSFVDKWMNEINMEG